MSMKINKVNKLPSNATWEDFGGSGEKAHFYHANGFPSGVYSRLLAALSQRFNLSALACRATWPNIGRPPRRRDWQLYADDLIAFIEHQYHEPIIGIGHSMGATCTILAADKRPDLFKALVLIETAMVSKPLAKLVCVLPKSFMAMIEPTKSTLKKTDIWGSREAFLADCRRFRGYKRFDDEAFAALAQHGLVETQAGHFKLGFPKAWEAHNYTQPPNVLSKLERINIPCVAIRGKPSVFFTDAMWHEWQDRCPDTIFKQNLAYGHLFPLENPSICYDLIDDGLSGIS